MCEDRSQKGDMGKAQTKIETTSFDRIIAVAAVVIMVIQFFIEKSRTSVLLAGVIIFLVALNPLTHLESVVQSKARQRLTTIGLFVVVALWVVSVWPKDRPPYSDLRIDKQQFTPFKAGTPPHLDLEVVNDSAYTIQAFAQNGIRVYDSLPDMPALIAAEKELWKGLEEHVRESRNTMSADDFYKLTIPPRVDTVVPVEGTTPLTESQAATLQSDKGQAFLLVATQILYRGENGEYGLENCIFTQGGNHLPNSCHIGHTGPIKFRPDHWWSKASDLHN
jgi:hypothetical protein